MRSVITMAIIHAKSLFVNTFLKKYSKNMPKFYFLMNICMYIRIFIHFSVNLIRFCANSTLFCLLTHSPGLTRRNKFPFFSAFFLLCDSNKKVTDPSVTPFQQPDPVMISMILASVSRMPSLPSTEIFLMVFSTPLLTRPSPS